MLDHVERTDEVEHGIAERQRGVVGLGPDFFGVGPKIRFGENRASGRGESKSPRRTRHEPLSYDRFEERARRDRLLERVDEQPLRGRAVASTYLDAGEDRGSRPLPLRRRVNSGEVPGPNILFAGDIFPKDGHPAYLPRQSSLTV